MAVQRTPQPGTAVLKIQDGLNSSGNPVYKTISFAGLKAAAADADVYDVLNGFGNLQTKPVAEIIRNDKNGLVNV